MTTEFYSAKLKRNVNIPNDKICGYKIAAPETKTGFKVGIRAIKSNGIVDEAIDQVSSELVASTFKPCPGNQNWLNKTKIFNKPKEMNVDVSITNRPVFLEGDVYKGSTYAPPLQPSRRSGNGNRELTRPSFKTPKSVGRQVVGFDVLRSQDIDQFGIKVQLGNKTKEELFSYEAPDVNDISWIAERDRLTGIFRRRGDSEEAIKERLTVGLPLGRNQRTVTKTSNFGSAAVSMERSNLTAAQKLNEIEEEIKQGRAESREQKERISNYLTFMMSSIRKINTLSNDEVASLSEALSKLNRPIPHATSGLPIIIDVDYWESKTADILKYISSNVENSGSFGKPDGVSHNKPLLDISSINQSKFGLPAKSIKTLLVGMTNNSNRKYLDLVNIRILNKAKTLVFIENLDGGWNNPGIRVDRDKFNRSNPGR